MGFWLLRLIEHITFYLCGCHPITAYKIFISICFSVYIPINMGDLNVQSFKCGVRNWLPTPHMWLLRMLVTVSFITCCMSLRHPLNFPFRFRNIKKSQGLSSIKAAFTYLYIYLSVQYIIIIIIIWYSLMGKIDRVRTNASKVHTQSKILFVNVKLWLGKTNKLLIASKSQYTHISREGNRIHLRNESETQRRGQSRKQTNKRTRCNFEMMCE